MILITGGAFQGKKSFALKALGIKEDKIYLSFNEDVRVLCDKGENFTELIDGIFNSGYTAVLSSEVGCGIVPLDRVERNRREMIGRAQCALAARCKEVWRVQCGIGTKIKG